MMIWKVSLVFFVYTYNSNLTEAKLSLFINSFYAKSNSKYFKYLITNLTEDKNEEGGGYVLSTSTEMIMEFTKAYVVLKIHFADNKYNCKQQTIFETKIDGCRFREQSLGLVAKPIYEPIMKSIDFELKCPFKARVYNVTNLRANLNIDIPAPDFGKYCVETEIYGKLKGKKGFEKVLSFGGSGTLTQKK